MALRREMPFHHPEPDDGQHDGAHGDMHAVKAGEHEKCRAVDAGAELQAQFGVGLVIFHRLQTDESEAQQECQRPERSSSAHGGR
jgi:hypothetical protein